MSSAIYTFAEERRAWIAAHAGILLFQKRRAELLGKAIRARDRARVGARPDPHDDEVTPPLVFRQTSTATGGFETAIVVACAVAAPIGWPVGRLLYGWITTLIPDRLLGYPIPALLGTAALCGLPLPLFYDPLPTLWAVVVTPWLLGQLPAIFLAAGIYGVLEGWLAVDGSSHWWPLTPVAAEVDDDVFLGGRDVAMPTILDPPPEAAPPARRKPLSMPRIGVPTIHWIPLLCSGIPVGLGITWYLWLILSALLSLPSELLQTNYPPATPYI
ncbi:hypothetical protein AFM11_35090 [Mycolicibacterium wolinskyi]|uniref:Uncharacterized protein n=1 Tax=Mycolicibacterium wolinskyi TaxID=59750 RepID=A0A132PBE0_9MYCO|nr:hypothetical protein [Mycolicibacterium wolinskyi]KWX19567.1 hypothetical protein AFM11_35090 [Mycolicibacterium wolinskyi]